MRTVPPSSEARSVPSCASGSDAGGSIGSAPVGRLDDAARSRPSGSGSSGPPQRAARSGSTACQVVPSAADRRGGARARADELDRGRAAGPSPERISAAPVSVVKRASVIDVPFVDGPSAVPPESHGTPVRCCSPSRYACTRASSAASARRARHPAPHRRRAGRRGARRRPPSRRPRRRPRRRRTCRRSRAGARRPRRRARGRRPEAGRATSRRRATSSR